ncbi:MAG: DUF3307 domain-containing protein [Bdellovibrionales bacterium]|nr:DUF3307 domain-containing protein [Bdellovibrionales bacterium]NQZ20274.1 DUF3307 domain-containing protein [Bdellovibrionales bacterium]
MNQQLELIFILLIIYQVKHYIADFPLQREYMLRKTNPRWDFALPLAMHCAVHGVGTLIICMVYAPSLWWLALVDFVVHFVADRLKSGPRYLGRFNDLSKPGFWNVLGLDQMIHHLTHIYIIYVIVTTV